MSADAVFFFYDPAEVSCVVNGFIQGKAHRINPIYLDVLCCDENRSELNRTVEKYICCENINGNPELEDLFQKGKTSKEFFCKGPEKLELAKDGPVYQQKNKIGRSYCGDIYDNFNPKISALGNAQHGI